ncbi:hypothetical protein [Lactiplantibacillus pentosus]|jgi:hypothetical protein|uniref:Uncharacterized protein n=2 Tax=Lactiplantibacillus TaxID=2767842 RepID=A0AAW8WAF5_LACPE|nr:hypothetical protein [Lactiplantibacillus pentosus]MDT6990087.1 hypothetical protein [Lactiplantibacillus pentosus]MDT7037576.1 hypothetical protein [Lactiplantibacillus pentosus]
MAEFIMNRDSNVPVMWLKDDKQTVSMQDVLADFDKPAEDE